MEQSFADLLDALDRARTPDDVWRVRQQMAGRIGRRMVPLHLHRGALGARRTAADPLCLAASGLDGTLCGAGILSRRPGDPPLRRRCHPDAHRDRYAGARSTRQSGDCAGMRSTLVRRRYRHPSSATWIRAGRVLAGHRDGRSGVRRLAPGLREVGGVGRTCHRPTRPHACRTSGRAGRGSVHANASA